MIKVLLQPITPEELKTLGLFAVAYMLAFFQSEGTLLSCKAYFHQCIKKVQSLVYPSSKEILFRATFVS